MNDEKESRLTIDVPDILKRAIRLRQAVTNQTQKDIVFAILMQALRPEMETLERMEVKKDEQ